MLDRVVGAERVRGIARKLGPRSDGAAIRSFISALATMRLRCQSERLRRLSASNSEGGAEQWMPHRPAHRHVEKIFSGLGYCEHCPPLARLNIRLLLLFSYPRRDARKVSGDFNSRP